MKPKTKEFMRTAAVALGDDNTQASLGGLYGGFNRARERAAEATPDWEGMRERARAIKAQTIENLDYYLELLEAKVTGAGGKVFFATDATAASRYVLDLARDRGVRMVIKGKSMVSEEMGLNDDLAEAGIEAVETDLGEYVIQLADQTPYHIIALAIHMSRKDVSDLFHSKLGSPRYEEISDIAGEARRRLREKFVNADMSITGVNFAVAETGTPGAGHQRRQWAYVHLDASNTCRHNGYGKGRARHGGPRAIPTAAHPFRYGPAHLQLRHYGNGTPRCGRGGRPGRASLRDRRQRAISHPG